MTKTFYKFFSIILVILLTISCFTTHSFAIFYTDTVGHWAKTYIDQMTNLQIIESSSSTYFYPSQYFTRKEVAKSGCMLFKEKNLTSSPIIFTDVATTNEYAKYIKWMYDNDVMSGTTTTTFSPNNNLLRQDMCVVLYNLYFERLEVPLFSYYSKVTYNDDSDISSYAKTAVYAMQKIGVIARGSTFRPKDYITRAEAATMLYEIWNYCMILSTPQQQQLNSNWCWAACAKILAEYRYSNSKTQTQIANYINSKYTDGNNVPRTIKDLAEGATWATYNNINHEYSDELSSETIISYVSSYKPVVLTHGYYLNNGKWWGHAMVCIGYVRDFTNEYDHHLFIYDVGDNSYFWVTYNDFYNGLNHPKVLKKKYAKSIYSL